MAAVVRQLVEETRRMPLRFRGFADLGDGGREAGEWHTAIELPIWRDGMTEKDLRTRGFPLTSE